jgi:hypothetical protein
MAQTVVFFITTTLERQQEFNRVLAAAHRFAFRDLRENVRLFTNVCDCCHNQSSSRKA